LAESNNGNGNNKKRSILLNWRLWVVFIIALVLVSIGISIAFGPGVVLKAATEPATYVGLIAGVGTVIAAFKGAYKFLAPLFAPLWEEMTKLRQKTEANSEVTKDNQTNITALGDAYRELINEYQQFRAENKADKESARAEILELKAQLREQTNESNHLRRNIAQIEDQHFRELSEIRSQLREAERQSASDKQEITLLRSRLNSLELDNSKLTLTIDMLREENRITNLNSAAAGRRITGPLSLTGLPPDIQKEFDSLRSNPPTIEGEDKEDA
jgi:hypothetical protein